MLHPVHLAVRSGGKLRVGRQALNFALIHVAIVLEILFVSTIIPVLFPLRWLAGIVLVLFLPGYAWTAALFVDRELSAVQRLCMSLGLSISISILAGLLLNLTPWGLGAVTLLATLSAVALCGGIVEAARHLRQLQNDTDHPLQLPHISLRELLAP